MIHPIDRVSGIALARGPSRLRFFAEGWGNAPQLRLEQITHASAEPLAIKWLSSHIEPYGLKVDHGAFTSPADSLPHRSLQGAVISVSPPENTNRVVVLMPAWNEHDPKVRVALAGHLARKGIRSILLENPFYGTRLPNPEHTQPIRTVSDFMVMGAAAVNEARGLLMWLHNDGWDVGVSGYSMGGNTSALVAATMPIPVAAAPLAASHSPGPVFLDGILREGIAWDALGGRSQEGRLRSTLGAVSVLNVDPAPHTRHAVIVRAAGDGYVPASAVQALSDHWPGSEVRTVRGGHATAIWYRKDQLTDAVADSFDRLGDA
ncbi:MAG: alpha/beta hydrolase family protein [Actinomycetota bacterium]